MNILSHLEKKIIITTLNTINLSSAGDLHKFAHRLYACLRDLDSMNIKKIAISPIPHQGIGRAINDRIKRASK